MVHISSINNSFIDRRYLHARLRNDQTTRIMMDEMNSGKKRDISVVDKIFGGRVESDVEIGKEISKKINNGLNITNFANAILENYKQQIQEIRNSILGLEYADKTALAAAVKYYNDRMTTIYNELKLVNFVDIRLFDGTLANAPTKKILSQNLPNKSAALIVQTGIENTNQKAISISRLLQGDGSLVNNPVIGTFNPLFTVTANTKAALAALDSVAPTTMDRVSNVKRGTQFWDGIDMSGSYGDQLKLIEAKLPKGVNTEQDLISDLATNLYTTMVKSYPTSEKVSFARRALTYAQASAKLVSLRGADSIDFDIALRNTIKIVSSIVGNPSIPTDLGAHAAASAQPNNPQAANNYTNNANASVIAGRKKIENINSTVSYAQSILKNIALAAYDAKDARKKTNTQILIMTALSLTKSFKTPFPNPIYIGNVLTSADRKQALEILDNMDNVLDSEIANINSSQNSLLQSKDTLNTQLIQLDDVAKSLLSPEYNKIIQKMLEIMRKDKTASIAQVLLQKSEFSRIENLTEMVEE